MAEKTNSQETQAFKMKQRKLEHVKKIERLESEKLIAKKKVCSEKIQMDDVPEQIRKEYEIPSIEF